MTGHKESLGLSDARRDLYEKNRKHRISYFHEHEKVESLKYFFVAKGMCHINDGVRQRRCPSNICSLDYYWKPYYFFNADCMNELQSFNASSVSITTFIGDGAAENESNQGANIVLQGITYTCKGNGCNSRNTTVKVQDIIEKKYNLSKFLKIMDIDEYSLPTETSTLTTISIQDKYTGRITEISNRTELSNNSIQLKPISDVVVFITLFFGIVLLQKRYDVD